MLGPYLHELSHGMDHSTALIRDQVSEALTLMQFQDVLRQILEQVEQGLQALGQCADHLSDAPYASAQLRQLVQQWGRDYVMLEQRMAHQGTVPAASTVDALADGGPRMELF